MLLIGFEDGTFAPDGKVPEDHGFEMTKIGQYLGERIRPIVKFSVHIDFHRESRYVVLSVREFEHMPHICEKDTPPLRSGDLYYRTERGETTAIRSSDDLNRLLLSAARKYHAWAQAVVGTAADPSATLLAEMERLLESERERFGNG